jgi:hypothetical protein
VVDPATYINNPPSQQRGIFYFSRFIAFGVILMLTVPAMSQPNAVVTDWKKNFGFVKKGAVVTNIYEISNTGNAPLMISRAEVACSCTSVEFSSEPLPPAAKTTVTVSFNTATVYGRQDRVVLLHCNDPKSPVKLRFKGVVMN